MGAWSGAGLGSGGASFAQTPPWQRPDGAPAQPPGSEPLGCRWASVPKAVGTLDAALALRRASAGPAHTSGPGVAAAQLGAAPSESMRGVAPSNGQDDDVSGPERGQSLESGGSQSLPEMVQRARWVRARTRTTTEAPDGASHALPAHLHPHQVAAHEAAWSGGTLPEASAGGSGEAARGGGETAGDGSDAGDGGGGGAAASAAAFLSAFDALGAFDTLTGLQPDPEGPAAAPAAALAQLDLHTRPAGRAEASSAPAAPPPGAVAASSASAPELMAPLGAAAPLRAPEAGERVLASDRPPAAAPASSEAGAAPAMGQAPPGKDTAAQGAPAAAKDGALVNAPVAPIVTALAAANELTLAMYAAPAAHGGALVTQTALTAAADGCGAAALPPARGAHKPHKVPAAPGAREMTRRPCRHSRLPWVCQAHEPEFLTVPADSIWHTSPPHPSSGLPAATLHVFRRWAGRASRACWQSWRRRGWRRRLRPCPPRSWTCAPRTAAMRPTRRAGACRPRAAGPRRGVRAAAAAAAAAAGAAGARQPHGCRAGRAEGLAAALSVAA